MNRNVLSALAILLLAACSGKTETCGAGTVDQSGTCVAVDAGQQLTCGAGTLQSDGTCLAVDGGPDIACGAGTTLINGACVADTTGTAVVSIVGLGKGTVTGTGLVCVEGTCTVTAKIGTPVVLTAVPTSGYAFVGWRGGGCSGTGTCQVTLTGYTTLKAGFSAVTFWGGDSYGLQASSFSGTEVHEVLPSKNPNLKANYSYDVSADGMTFAVNAGQNGGNNQLWAMDFWNGLSLPVATNTNWGAVYGSLSPDASLLAYFSNSSNTLTVVHIDGTPSTFVSDVSRNDIRTNDCHNAGCATTRFFAWSPDSTKLAWISTLPIVADGTDSTYENIWVAGIDGSAPSRLTNYTSASIASSPRISGLDWSADGSRIAFVSQQEPGSGRTGTAAVTVTNLWTIDVTSKALFCVTNFATEHYLDMATYARTGHLLVFSSNQDPTLTADNAEGRNLFSIVDDGTGLAALTTSTVSNAFNAGQYWAPDRTTLLFESNIVPTDTTTRGNYGIWKVTPGTAAAASVVYSPQDEWDYSPLDNND